MKGLYTRGDGVLSVTQGSGRWPQVLSGIFWETDGGTVTLRIAGAVPIDLIKAEMPE